MSKRLERPGGHPPPEAIWLGDKPIDILAIARDVTAAFLARFPDELDRYEDRDRVHEWCTHDTRHLIGWAAAEAHRGSPLAKQLDWLGMVLESRGYPVQRLGDTLEIAADVLNRHHGSPARPVADALRAGARHVRATPTFIPRAPDAPQPRR